MRPYPPTGITTAEWMQTPPIPLAIADLVPTQKHVRLWPLLRALVGKPTSHCGDPHPHVVLHEGVFYLEDGHTRVKAARLRGETTIRARVKVVR